MPHVPGATVTDAGVHNNVYVSLQYLTAWLQGTGAVAIYNLMEDAATTEIARAQLWQWIHHGASTDTHHPPPNNPDLGHRTCRTRMRGTRAHPLARRMHRAEAGARHF